MNEALHCWSSNTHILIERSYRPGKGGAAFLSDSCCWDFDAVTLAFEDANSKLLDVVSIAELDIDAEVKSMLTTVW